MKTKHIIITLLGVLLSISSQAQKDRNIYCADPTIMYFDGMYYMYATEKAPQKGIPVLQSKDLKTWEVPSNTLNGYALKTEESTFGTWGFWAPQVLKRDNKYYMVYTANENIAIAESNNPVGLYTQKNIAPLKADKRQIDPYVFFDDDGKIYFYHVRLDKGNTIWVAEFEKDLSGIKENTLKQCITATEDWENTQTFKSAPIIEGPTVIKRNGLYYLFYSANHFESLDYSVGYATSKSPYGPWEKAGNNPIINRSNIGQNGTGHGDLFQDAKGDWKYVFHVHCNDSTVQPRRVMAVDLLFSPNAKTGTDIVTIDRHSLYPLLMKE